MRIAILADQFQREEWMAGSGSNTAELIWHESLDKWLAEEAAIFIDLLFTAETERIAALRNLLPQTVIINAVTQTLQQLSLIHI